MYYRTGAFLFFILFLMQTTASIPFFCILYFIRIHSSSIIYGGFCINSKKKQWRWTRATSNGLLYECGRRRRWLVVCLAAPAVLWSTSLSREYSTSSLMVLVMDLATPPSLARWPCPPSLSCVLRSSQTGTHWRWWSTCQDSLSVSR